MNGTRFQRGHLYEAFGSFHVKFYQTEVVDLVLVRPDRMFPEREDMWEVADSGDFAAKIERHQPPVKSSGWALCVRVANWNRCRRSYRVRRRGNDCRRPAVQALVRRVAEGMP